MKALLTRRSITIAVIAVLIAVVTLVFVNLGGSNGPITGLANTVSKPLQTLAANVARVFENIYSSIYRYDDLMAQYEILAKRLSERERDYREANDLRAENERFRALFGFQERHRGYEQEQATVVSRSGDNWSSSFTINIGYENSKIARGNGVATEYGVLIGQVTDVGARDSTVITVLDTTFSAGAFVGEGEGRATVKGDFSLMRSGLLMLDRIGDKLIILPGDSVVTSGVSGIFPAGLIVGEVVEVHRHSTGIGRYATVKPMRDVDTITHVFVITGFDVPDQAETEAEG